ncbi:MAG: hypothetical protein ACR2K2_07930 [Mycobacteriales bacterium]
MGLAVGRDRVATAVCGLPERLLLVLLWTCVAVAVCTVVGQHRPLVLVPLAAVVVAATWRWRPVPLARRRGDLFATVACLLLLAVWVGVQVPLTGERLVISRDPDVYTLTALWLVDHASVSVPVPDGSVGVLSFDPARGALQPQGAHLVPALSAVLGWGWGTAGVLAANLVWGAFGLLGVFALGRRVVGAAWALLPVAALALSLPMIDFSRSMYSEPLSLALTMLGGALLLAAWESGRRRDFVLCGVALGAVSLARVDGALVTLGVVGGLTGLAVLTGRTDVPGRRWSSLLVAAGATPLALVGVVDIARYTVGYFEQSRPQLVALAAAALALTVGSAIVASLAVAGGHTAKGNGVLVRRTAVVATGALGLLWAVLATRPWWLVSRGETPSAAVAALQLAAGVAVEPRQSYDQDTLTWLAWYYGVVPVAVGPLALTAWLLYGLRDRGSGRLACLLLLVLPSTLLYLWSPRITPDQVWAVRRFVPVVLPALLLGTAWGLRELAVRGRLRQGVAAVLAVATMAWPAATLPGLWSVRDSGGTLAGVREVCDAVAGRPAVVTGNDTLLPTVLIVCGVPAYGIRATATPARLAEAYRALGGGDIAVVTRDPAGLAVDGAAPRPVDVRFTMWEPTLLRRPETGRMLGTLITVGAVDGEGRVWADARR